MRPIGCHVTFRIQVDMYPMISNLGNRVPFRIPLATTYNCLTTALGCHRLTLPLPSHHTIPRALAQQPLRCRVLDLAPAAFAAAAATWEGVDSSSSSLPSPSSPPPPLIALAFVLRRSGPPLRPRRCLGNWRPEVVIQRVPPPPWKTSGGRATHGERRRICLRHLQGLGLP